MRAAAHCIGGDTADEQVFLCLLRGSACNTQEDCQKTGANCGNVEVKCLISTAYARSNGTSRSLIANDIEFCTHGFPFFFPVYTGHMRVDRFALPSSHKYRAA